MMSANKGILSLILIVALISGIILLVGRASTSVSAQELTAVKLTTSPRYDRNPSFFKASDGTYWLFFVRTVQDDPNYPNEGEGCDEGDNNCDASSYEIFYMTSTDGGNTWSAPVSVPGSAAAGHRGMAALQDKSTGKIWVFVSGPGGDGKINYYIFDGTTWTGPTLITNPDDYPNGISGSHVDAIQAKDGKIWVFYQDGGYGVKAIYYNGEKWSDKITVSSTANDGIPKAIQDSNGKFHVIMANWAADGAYHYATSTDGMTWNAQSDPIAISGTVSCDPVIYEDSAGHFWIFYAPWDDDTNSQWIEAVFSTDGGVTWSSRIRWTTGGTTESWWDMWPEVFEDDGRLLLFYTSEEKDDGTRGDGNIWMLTIQTATKNGVVKFSSSEGVIEYPTSVDEATLPTNGKPALRFPYGFFSFKITDIQPGSTVTVTMTFPSYLPKGTEYWKYHNGWIDVTSLLGDNDGDNVLTLTLTDGGLGDEDGTANGVIVDQGGPGIPLVVGGEIESANTAALVKIIIQKNAALIALTALGAAIVAVVLKKYRL